MNGLQGPETATPCDPGSSGNCDSAHIADHTQDGAGIITGHSQDGAATGRTRAQIAAQSLIGWRLLALSFALLESFLAPCVFTVVLEAVMAANPWDPLQPTAAALLIERCLGAGVLSQNVLDKTWKESPCFSRVEELEKISTLKDDINQKSLELEMLRLEKETADITHSFYLGQKYDALQAINTHLEAVLREKRSLRQRLAKPLCQENLPIEASYHRFVSELLPLSVKFIEKLEVYIQTIHTIPRIPESAKTMDNELVRMEALEADLEEVTEQILTWREKKIKLVQGNSKINKDKSSSINKGSTSYLSIENRHR